MSSYKDKYPRPCGEFCPRCKKPCMNKMEKHTDADGNITAHICGPHWWIKVIGPDCMKIEVSGMIGIRRVTP